MKKLMSKRAASLYAVILGSLLAAADAGANDAAAGAKYYSSKNLRVVESPMPAYPYRARQNAIEGYTVVEFTVLPDGSVVEPAIADSSYSLFGEAAVEALQTWKFEPVTEGEATVPVRSSLRFNFVGESR